MYPVYRGEPMTAMNPVYNSTTPPSPTLLANTLPTDPTGSASPLAMGSWAMNYLRGVHESERLTPGYDLSGLSPAGQPALGLHPLPEEGAGSYTTVAQSEAARPQTPDTAGAPTFVAASPAVTPQIPSFPPPPAAPSLPAGVGWADSAQFCAGDLQPQMARRPDEDWYAQQVREQAQKRQADRAWRSGEAFPPAIDPRTQAWADTFGAQNYPGEKMPDSWMYPRSSKWSPQEDATGAIGAIPRQLQSSATEFAKTPYLAPVPTAPDWEQVPLNNTRSARASVPSATSWGSADRGVICDTADGITTCTTPGGRQFSFPAWQGFPERIEPGMEEYHYYSRPVSGPPVDPARVTQALVNRPTVGPGALVSPATVEGTLNEATPEGVYYAVMKNLKMPDNTPFNQVKSYLTTDQNGQKVIVNVTQPQHGLSPGMVFRYVTETPSGTTIQTEGTGLGRLQGPSWWGGGRDLIAGVWRQQGQQVLADPALRR